MKTWVLLFGIVVLALTQLLFYLYQRRFTFLPTYYPDRSLFDEHASVYGLHWLNVAQNVEIEGIVYEPDHTALTILYFGGKEQDSVSLIRQWSLEYPNVRRFIIYGKRVLEKCIPTHRGNVLVASLAAKNLW